MNMEIVQYTTKKQPIKYKTQQNYKSLNLNTLLLCNKFRIKNQTLKFDSAVAPSVDHLG